MFTTSKILFLKNLNLHTATLHKKKEITFKKKKKGKNAHPYSGHLGDVTARGGDFWGNSICVFCFSQTSTPSSIIT